MDAPRLLTFDVFGTLVDWREGLRRDLAAHGLPLDEPRWDSVLADQDQAEHGAFGSYRDITTWSLVRRLGLPRRAADRIARDLGRWPLFPDTRDALERLLRRVPCVGMTNSDRSHGAQVQEQLGFPLSGWICAEDVHLYKPAPGFWRAVSQRLQVPLAKSWWHVSAYGAYDLRTAASLGLTTVFVRRPHSRPAPADLEISDLTTLLPGVNSQAPG